MTTGRAVSNRPLLVAVAVLGFALSLCAVACKGESAPEKEAWTEASTSASPTTGSAGASPGEPVEPAGEPDAAGGLVERVEAAGFVVAAEVPFDDDGALPAALADGKAPGQLGTSTWVFRRAADDTYVQLFVATFDSADAARAAAVPGAQQRDAALIVVLPLGDSRDAVEAVESALR